MVKFKRDDIFLRHWECLLNNIDVHYVQNVYKYIVNKLIFIVYKK